MNPMNLQITQVCGRLVKDPQLKETPTGKIVMEFTLAYNTRSSTDSLGSHTSFLTIEAWEKLAEKYILHLKKGIQIIVKGELVQNRWKDTEGKIYSKVKIVAENIEINDLKRRPNPDNGSDSHSSEQDQNQDKNEEENKSHKPQELKLVA